MASSVFIAPGIGGGGIGTSSDTEVLFNSAGTVDGDAGLTFVAATDTLSTGAILTGDGLVTAPAQSFTSAPTVGAFFGAGGYQIAVGASTLYTTSSNWRWAANVAIQWSTTTSDATASADVVLSRGAADLLALASGDSFNLVLGSLRFANVVAFSGTAPTIASGFGTSPSIASSNGSVAFTINVGTGGTATAGVITLPAATTGWVVHCLDITNGATAVTVQTAGTTTSATISNFSRTTGLLTAWAASDIIRCTATAY